MFCSKRVDLIQGCNICCNPNSISYAAENENVIYFEELKNY